MIVEDCLDAHPGFFLINAARALVAVALLGTALPSAAPLTVRYDEQRFTTCEEAAQYAREHDTVGRYQYRIGARLENGFAAATGASGYRAAARVRFSLEPEFSVLELPQWSWPGQSAAQRSELAQFVESVRLHEMGHRLLAERALRGRDAQIGVYGKDAESAKRRLRERFAALLSDLTKEIAEKENLYDRVTDHGIHQSEAEAYGFPAGPDIVFSCR
ncbi:MAG: hypothetical protein DLM50_08900 [Candidatus Meridianibacter frigidus]|nr:MAG: hypothetical protein DLM50_08900 [Candidatus Eremiobacteraeota bacterium]